MVQPRCAHMPAPRAGTGAALPRWKADPSVTVVHGMEIAVAGEEGPWFRVPEGSWDQRAPRRGAGSITSQVGSNGCQEEGQVPVWDQTPPAHPVARAGARLGVPPPWQRPQGPAFFPALQSSHRSRSGPGAQGNAESREPVPAPGAATHPSTGGTRGRQCQLKSGDWLLASAGVARSGVAGAVSGPEPGWVAGPWLRCRRCCWGVSGTGAHLALGHIWVLLRAHLVLGHI